MTATQPCPAQPGFDLVQPDVPLFTLPPLRGARTTPPYAPALYQSAALDAVLTERQRQIQQFGHTAAADDARDLWDMTKTAGRFLHRMNETASLHRVEQTRRDAVQLSAYAMAVAESCDRRILQRAATAHLPL